MSSEPQTPPEHVELPRSTSAPLVLAAGLALLAAGLAFGAAFLIVGGVVAAAGLILWIAELVPGAGHEEMPLVEPQRRARPVTGVPGGVEQLRPGAPGYRLRLPEAVHPISAGLKGGIAGGIIMPVPALLWGLLSGHGIWYPVNLLAGMLLPGVDEMTVAQLEQSQPLLLVVGAVIHVTMSLVLGLIYGVLLPTLPEVPAAVAWGGLLAPLLWTASSYALLGVVSPVLRQEVGWPWFIASQFVFGISAAAVILQSRWHPVLAGLAGGAAGGLLMPIPALLWSIFSGHSPWYPANLLAGMILTELGQAPPHQLDRFDATWLAAALALHVSLSIIFGVLLGVVHAKLPHMPAPMVWGGLVLPLLWTGISYGLMGVVNPVLEERIDWPWFIVSQFVFGMAAAIVVHRSEMVYIPPAGPRT
jgi:hypothetical protein